MILTFANTKGGVGKTTSAIFTALALAQHHDVNVLDADPQGSASQWALMAADEGNPLPFPVEAVNHATLRRLKSREGVTIIDTPPTDAAAVELAARAADLIVIPTGASGLDLTRTFETYDALEDTVRAVLITSAEPRTKLFQDTVAALDAAEMSRFATFIRKRQGIKDAYGHRPSNLHGYEELATEIQEVME